MNRKNNIIGFAVLFALTSLNAPFAQGQRPQDGVQSSDSGRIASQLLFQLQDDDPVSQPPVRLNMQAGEDVFVQEESARQMAQREFGKWPRKELREIVIDIRSANRVLPRDQSAQLLEANELQWTQFNPSPKVFAWVAPDIRYQPLYFEDVALERYGQTLPPYKQSIMSSVHFFKSLVFLPNQMRHDCPGDCDYPLGFCRPGNSVPCTYQRQYFGLHVR